MARNTKLAIATVNRQAEVLAELLADGFLDFFDGRQPDMPEAPITVQKLLGGIRFGSPAFTEPVEGTIVAMPATPGFAIDDGEATWARLFCADHRTPAMDLSVGTRDANAILETTKFERGAIISLIAFEHSIARSSPGI